MIAEVIFLTGKKVADDINKFKYDQFKLYKKGGYLTIGTDKVNILMDAAELGFGAIAAHGHADALSIIYYNLGNPIIIDSGTYIYNIEEDLLE